MKLWRRLQNGSTRRAAQRASAIGVAPDELDLSELRELLRTAGVAVTGEMVQRRERPDPDRYFGRGKLAELKQAAKDADANLIAVDDELLPRQERNLEEELGIPVIDRTAIILDIFADHARSAEGKLQVELAQLEYNLARMRGLWTHLERLGAGRMDGGIGTRGPGESQIETDRRLARNRISALRRRLRDTKATRATMRKERDRAGLPTVALAGYTNAGKSTLLNTMTGAEVGVRERLFHTLDPTTRSFEISGRQYLLTDTVGFIRKLPHQLVEAFSATLEEALGADLILHVVDASVPEDELHQMMAAVDDVLDEIGAGDTPRLAGAEQGRPPRRRAPPRAVVPLPGRRPGLGRQRRRPRRPSRGDRGALPRDAQADGAARALPRGRNALGAARPGRRARARGHGRGRAHPRPGARGGGAPLRALLRERRRRPARLKPEFAHFAFTQTCKPCTSCAVEHRALPEWKGRSMVTHGSESYYVIGEGLLGESVGGRDDSQNGAGPARAAAAAAGDAGGAPPFRFSRMGPNGSGKQLGRGRAQEARRGDGESRRRQLADPGRVHLPRPVHRPRPDVRQDRR